METAEHLAKMLEVQRIIQQHFPECVLVGGTAAAFYARHRYSLDIDSVMKDLRSQFAQVLTDLEELAGWKTNRITPPVQILGSYNGIEVGIRQLIRSEPLETEYIQGIRIPTLPEMLRVKGFLIVKRNALRDYLDFCALADKTGDEFENAMVPFDRCYPQPPETDTTSQQLCRQLAEPRPRDLVPGVDLSDWKGLSNPWSDWSYVENYCRNLAGRLLDLSMDLPRRKEEPGHAPPSSDRPLRPE